jgi:hypothetical protein
MRAMTALRKEDVHQEEVSRTFSAFFEPAALLFLVLASAVNCFRDSLALHLVLTPTVRAIIDRSFVQYAC